MKLGSVLEGLMLKLSVIPGLGFLASYVTEFHGRQTRIQQQIGDYMGYARAARDAGSDVAQAGRSLKKEEEPEEEDYEEDYEEDDESYLQ